MKLNFGLMYALVAAVGLGCITTFAKLVYADGGNALTLMFWRFLMSVLVIGSLVLMRRQSLRVARSMGLPVLVLGVVWSGAMIAYLLSVQYISVGIAVVVLYSYPLMVLVVSVGQGRLRLSLGLVLLFFMAFAGIALMLLNEPVVLSPIGLGFAALAAVGAAYTFLSGERVAVKMDPMVLTFWVNGAGLLVILPMILPVLAGDYRLPQSFGGLLALAEEILDNA